MSAFSEVADPLYSRRSLGISETVAFVRRHVRVMVAIILASTAIAAVASLNMPKFYTASSTLVLERSDVRPFEFEVELQRQLRDRSAAETEMDILTSRFFGGRVVDAMGLIKDPRFNTYLPPVEEPLRERIRLDLAERLSFFPLSLRERLGLGPPPASRWMPNETRQRDRAITALLSHVKVTRRGESLAVFVQVSHEDPELAAAVANSMAKFYVESSLELKQNAKAALRMRAHSTGGAVAFLRERIAQPLLGSLRGEEARILRERADLASTYGSNHPKLVKADAELASVRQMLDEEIQRILLDLEDAAARPSARIVSSAEVPTAPSSPSPRFVVSSAFVGSTLLAFLIALLLEATDKRIRSGERVSQLLRLPNLAYALKIPRRGRGARDPVSYIAQRPQSAFAESMRSLYLACRVSSTDNPRQTLMITSCLPEEGKTSVALGLAMTAASDGRRTVLLDLDLHRCGVRQALGIEFQGPTLENLLLNECRVDEAAWQSPKSPNLHVIGANRRPKQPSLLLNSARLRDVIATLKSEYEVVIVDTPPILIVDDANWLTPLVDGVIVVVHWGKTNEDALIEAAERLRMNHAPLLGTVINKVDPNLHARHGHGGTLKYVMNARGYFFN